MKPNKTFLSNMAEGESITFGDFGAGATFYEEVVGESALSQTPLSLGVQFPWDNVESSPTFGGDASSNNFTTTQGGVGFQQPVKENIQQTTHYTLPEPGPVYSNTIQPLTQGSAVTQGEDASAINVRTFPNVNNPQNGEPTDPLSSTESVQKSNSLKRRNKKQRDPNYYNNFYNNPELYSGQRQEGDLQRSDETQSQMGRRKEAPSNDPSFDVQVGPEHSLQPEEISHQEVVSQRDTTYSEHNLQNVQLDERTTGINVKPVENVAAINENQSSSANSTSLKVPSPSVPPTAARTDGVDTLPKVPSIQNTTNSSHPKIVSDSQTVLQDAPQLELRPEQIVGNETMSGHVSVEEQSQPKNSETSGNLSQEQQVPAEKENVDGEQASGEQAKAPAAPKPSPWGSKPTSWASLFRKEGANSIVMHSERESKPVNQVPSADNEGDRKESVDPVTTDKDPQIRKLGEFLKNVQISNKPMFIQPRGLINVANNCYINSILQVIVACPPFYNLFQRLPIAKRRGPSSTPMLDAITDLCKQFEDVPLSGKKNSKDVRPGEPFEPVGVYQMLRKVNTTLSIKHGRQEDAEEFLSCMLNGFHEEMIAAMEAAYPPKPQANGPSTGTPNGVASDHEGEDDEDEEWEQVGPKKKATITRVADFTKSPIYDIFGGQMRSALHQHGARESAMLQPFFTLQLDIQSPKITNVKEALENFGTKEAVHGFMSNKTKTEVEASKRTSLEELPPALILHLKQFVYDKTGGCQKLTKKMDYDMDLEINKELLSPTGRAKIPAGQRTYKLFAVVYHTGKEASGGHYISDYYHAGSNSWIRADDNNIKPVKPHQVLNPLGGLTPYLLVYRRREMPSSHNSGNS